MKMSNGRIDAKNGFLRKSVHIQEEVRL